MFPCQAFFFAIILKTFFFVGSAGYRRGDRTVGTREEQQYKQSADQRRTVRDSDIMPPKQRTPCWIGRHNDAQHDAAGASAETGGSAEAGARVEAGATAETGATAEMGAIQPHDPVVLAKWAEVNKLLENMQCGHCRRKCGTLEMCRQCGQTGYCTLICQISDAPGHVHWCELFQQVQAHAAASAAAGDNPAAGSQITAEKLVTIGTDTCHGHQCDKSYTLYHLVHLTDGAYALPLRKVFFCGEVLQPYMFSRRGGVGAGWLCFRADDDNLQWMLMVMNEEFGLPEKQSIKHWEYMITALRADGIFAHEVQCRTLDLSEQQRQKLTGMFAIDPHMLVMIATVDSDKQVTFARGRILEVNTANSLSNESLEPRDQWKCSPNLWERLISASQRNADYSLNAEIEEAVFASEWLVGLWKLFVQEQRNAHVMQIFSAWTMSSSCNIERWTVLFGQMRQERNMQILDCVRHIKQHHSNMIKRIWVRWLDITRHALELPFRKRYESRLRHKCFWVWYNMFRPLDLWASYEDELALLRMSSRSTIRALENKVEEQQATCAQLQATIRELQATINQQKEQNYHIFNEFKQLREKYTGAETQIEQLQQHHMQLEQELEEKSALLAQKENSLAQADEEWIRQFKELEQLAGDKARCEAHMQQTQQELQQAQQELQQTQKELQQTQQELQQAQQKLEQQLGDDSQCKNECCVCMEQPRSHMFLPCRHFVVCGDCASSVHKDKGKCPTCFAATTGVLQIFRM